ncbi:MAG TPA: response regulator [Bacteroidetes bacterium]|nr:response regulator [Bacteroidota bacterium]
MEDKKLIYVVDDDPFILNLVEKKLTREGFDVRVFKYGEECLAAMDTKPDIVVLDYLFVKHDDQVMNGKEIFSHIKEKYPDMPVIMLSGQDSGDVVLELARLGMNDYVIKDQFLIENLVVSLRDILYPDEE